METVTVSGARGRLYRLLDEVAASREPVLIAGKRAKAVLVPEEDWRAIQETLYLLSVPGMRESIREGMATPVSECAAELKWCVGKSYSPFRRSAIRGRLGLRGCEAELRSCWKTSERTSFRPHRVLSG